MAKPKKKLNLKELVLQNIKEVESDKRILEKIETRIDEKFMKEAFSK